MSLIDEEEICGRCELYGTCMSHKIPARIMHKPKKKTTKKVLGIFMNPGKDEDKKGEILVGKAGQLTQELVSTYWKDYEVWATNPVKCYHNPSEVGGTLKAKWIKDCNTYLIEDILRVKPTLIVLHGTVAKNAYNYIFELYDKELKHYNSLKTDRRRSELEDFINWYAGAVEYIRTIPTETTVHPASTFYTMPVEELENIYIRVDQRLQNKLKKVPYTKDLTKVLENINRKGVFGLDTEWNPDTNEVHTIGLATNTIGTAVPFKKGLPILKKLLANPKLTCIGFNIVSDISMLLGMGINKIRCKFIDALILRRELIPDMFQTTLKETFAYKWLLIENYWEDVTTEDFKLGYTEKIARYCTGDAWASVKAVDFLIEDYKEEYKDMARARQIDMDLIVPVAYMNYRGIKLSRTHINKYRIESKEISERIEADILHNYNVNPGSPAQVLEYLRSQGYNIKKTDKAELSKITDCEFAKELLEYRKHSKLYSTYFDKLIGSADKDLIIHINLNIAGAVTGRFTSSNPNMQNQSKKHKDCFMTKFGNDGCIMSWDGDQQEYRVYAYLSQYKELIDMYKDGGDIHNWTQDKLGLKERRPAKNINFGFIFGAGFWKLTQQLVENGIAEHKAKRLVQDYMDIMEPIRQYQEKVWQQVEETGVCTTPYGRLGTRLNYTNAINLPVQGFASDINKERLLWMYREMETAGLASHIWLEFHDEVVGDIYKPEKEQVGEMIAYCYEELKYIPDVYDYGINLEIPMEVTDHGKYWTE